MDEAGDRTLRAKYLDWCSARIAEQFLDLSPEEIYELAHPVGAGVETGRPSPLAPVPPAPVLPPPHDQSYRALIQRVTDILLLRMSLPTFEQWAEAYRESPTRFDAELLGFWKDVADDEGR